MYSVWHDLIKKHVFRDIPLRSLFIEKLAASWTHWEWNLPQFVLLAITKTSTGCIKIIYEIFTVNGIQLSQMAWYNVCEQWTKIKYERVFYAKLLCKCRIWCHPSSLYEAYSISVHQMSTPIREHARRYCNNMRCQHKILQYYLLYIANAMEILQSCIKPSI